MIKKKAKSKTAKAASAAAIPAVPRDSVKEILEDEGNGHFKVRTDDGRIADVVFED
jgi:hypothetical protein